MKDIQERNYLLRWGILIGLLTFVCLTVSIYYIDFDVFRNPTIVKDKHLRIALLLISLFFTIQLVHVFIKLLAYYLNTRYLARFKHLPTLGTFEESNTQRYTPVKKYRHMVLLLHGFTASPQEFTTLTQLLKQQEIPYFCPTILGFGLDNAALLRDVRYEDWFRAALEYYDFLTPLADEVSIVGHSLGGILATFIAQNRKVTRLVLSGPGIYSVDDDLKYKRLLNLPVISTLFMKLFPYLPKPIRQGRKTTSDTLDESITPHIFQYMAVPVAAAQQIFLAQDTIQLNKLSCQSLLILYGKHDLTVNMKKLFNALNENHVTYQSRCFENSAHNILEDYERAEACEYIISFLTYPIVC